MSEECQAAIPEPPHYLHRHQCPRNASTLVAEVPLCKQHARKANENILPLIDDRSIVRGQEKW